MTILEKRKTASEEISNVGVTDPWRVFQLSEADLTTKLFQVFQENLNIFRETGEEKDGCFN